jgi:hypothetical protein
MRCNGKSAGAGGLIDGDKMMLFLRMIDGGDMTLLLACAGGLINGRVTAFLLSVINGLASYVQRQVGV